MLMRFLQLFVFMSIVQPGELIPAMESSRPFFVLGVVVGIGWLTSQPAESLEEAREATLIRRLIIGLAICETIPAVLDLYLALTTDIISFWAKIIAVFLFVYYLVKSEEDIWKVLSAVLLATIVHVGVATHIYLMKPELMLDGRLATYGMYSGANDYGLLLTCSIPIVLKLSEKRGGFIRSIVSYMVVVVFVVHVFLTGSRGSMLGTTAVIALSFWTRIPGSRFLKVVGIVVVMAAMGVVGARMTSEIRQGASFAGGDDSAIDRIDAWAACGRMLAHYPLGVGFNQSQEYIQEFGLDVRLRPHNTSVKVAAEAGVIGFVCFSGFMYLAASCLMKLDYRDRILQDDRKGIIAQALLIPLVGFSINTSFSQKEYEYLLYIVLACTAKLITLRSKDYNTDGSFR